MAKYKYTDGERRYYKGVEIIRHANHRDCPHLVWYVQMSRSISSSQCRNFCPTITTRVYFEKLVDAHQYIDRFMDFKKTKYPYYECMNGMEREALIHMDL